MLKRSLATAFASVLLCGWGEPVASCSEPDIVQLATEAAIDEVRIAFEQAVAIGSIVDGRASDLAVAVKLSEFRQYQSYDESISKRYCEATSLTTVTGMGQIIQMGMVVNGIDPREFERGVDGTIRYSIQLTEDGTQLVSLED